MDLAWSRWGCKGCEKHIPVLWRGLWTSFRANGNTELVTSSAHQAGVVSPSPPKWSRSIMQNTILHYPHHCSLCPSPVASAAKACWGLHKEGCFGDSKTFCRSLINPLSHMALTSEGAQSIYYRPVNKLFLKVVLKYIIATFPITCMSATAQSCNSLLG